MKLIVKIVTFVFLPLTVVFYGLIHGQLQFHRQYGFFGHCLDYPAVFNLNLTRYMGRWYQVEKYYTFKDLTESCVQAEYIKGQQPNTFRVKNSQTTLLTGNESILRGKARPLGTNSSLAKFTIKFRGVKEETPYVILSTDYDNYSLIFSCKDAGPFLNFQIAWVLSRNKTISKYYSGLVHRKLRQLGVRTYFLHTTFDQKFCPDFED